MEGSARLARAICIASLFPAFVFCVEALGCYATLAPILFYTLMLYVPCLFFTALAGVPVFYLLRRWNLIRWWSASASGFIATAIPFLATDGLRAFERPVLHSEALLWSLLGGATALLVWAFWRVAPRASSHDA